MAIGLVDVARKTRLSTQTVGQILNSDLRRIRYAPDTVQRVLTAAAELGYRPNLAARALVTRKTHLVGLWMPEFRQAYYANFLSHLEDQSRQRGYDAVVGRLIGTQPQRFDSMGWSFDGAIAVDAGVAPLDPSAAAALSQPSPERPFVSIGNFCLPDVDAVGFDLREVASEAVRHLIDGGARRVGYLAPAGAIHPSESRYGGYLDAVAEAGRAPIVVPAPRVPGPEMLEHLRAVLGADGAPDALFIHHDELAIIACRVLSEIGRRVGRDVTVVGCGGIDQTLYLQTSLSTIDQPIEQMCTRAWDFLEKRMADPSLPRQVATLRPQLVIRESSSRRTTNSNVNSSQSFQERN